MTDAPYLSVAQVASRLGITRQAVLKRIHAGRLPASKVGRAYVVPARALDLQHDRTLAEIVRRLVEAYEPERVYLFGSAARGDTGPESDYDVLLVVPDDASRDRRDSRRAYEVMWSLGVAADILVWTRADFDETSSVVTSLPATVLREGVLLHAA